MSTTFGIKNKATGELFAGFDKSGGDVWTNDATNAWSGSRLTANAQAALFLVNGIPAQRKVLAL